MKSPFLASILIAGIAMISFAEFRSSGSDIMAILTIPAISAIHYATSCAINSRFTFTFIRSRALLI